MKIKIKSECSLEKNVHSNILRNCILKKGFRVDILVDDKAYMALIDTIKEESSLICEVIVVFDSSFAVSNYKEIFKSGKYFYIVEGFKNKLAKCEIISFKVI